MRCSEMKRAVLLAASLRWGCALLCQADSFSTFGNYSTIAFRQVEISQVVLPQAVGATLTVISITGAARKFAQGPPAGTSCN